MKDRIFFEYESGNSRLYANSLAELLKAAPECNRIRREVDGRLVEVTGEERDQLLGRAAA